MQFRRRKVVLSLLGVAVLAFAAAATQDSNRQLQESLGDTDVHESWIYNDVDAAFADAKRTKKPLLVVFRCVS
jgi:hypothetical protein